MTPVVVGAAGVIALILLTSRGYGLDFDRRSVSTAYASGTARAARRTRRLRSKT
ncbi:hypothetical protein [Rhodococcoides yunnanense]|uniref:Uncharacterized protein n=1 Tax=Rhodococcoides yunnanense TaxID=278209 RepID=A0ABU4B6U0_9NOCA|nr:hypothetical protein [Rhodococcus yunnanensis]MDV6259908.1 hypothetical protein [Rhodococcus yunnanensis]